MTPTDRFARAAIDLYKLTNDDAPEVLAACREFVAAERELTGAPSLYDEQLARDRDAAVADLRAVAEAIGCELSREAMVAAVSDEIAANARYAEERARLRADRSAAEKARDNLERSVNDLFHAIGYSGNDLDGAVRLAEEQRKAAKSASALTAEGTLKATIADLRAKLAAAEQARKEAADLADHWQSVAERHNTGPESEQLKTELTEAPRVAPFDLPALEWASDNDGVADPFAGVGLRVHIYTDKSWCLTITGNGDGKSAAERARSLLTGEAQAGAEVNHHDLASLLSTMGGIVAALPVAGVRTTVSDILQGRGDLARAVAEVAMSMRVAIDYVAAVFGRHGLTRGEMNAVYRLNTDHETMAAIATRLAMVAITARPDRSADDKSAEPCDTPRPVAVLTEETLRAAMYTALPGDGEHAGALFACLTAAGPVAMPAPVNREATPVAPNETTAPVVVAPVWKVDGVGDHVTAVGKCNLLVQDLGDKKRWTVNVYHFDLAPTIEAAKSAAVAFVAGINGARVIDPEQVAREYQDGEASFPWEALTEKERADAIATMRRALGGAK